MIPSRRRFPLNDLSSEVEVRLKGLRRNWIRIRVMVDRSSYQRPVKALLVGLLVNRVTRDLGLCLHLSIGMGKFNISCYDMVHRGTCSKGIRRLKVDSVKVRRRQNVCVTKTCDYVTNITVGII